MTVIRKMATKLDYRHSMECASSVAKLVTRQITAIRKMPMVCPTNLWQEARVAIPTRTYNAMDVVRLVTSQRMAGKGIQCAQATIRMEIIQRNWSCQH
jgi:hypothetical protein